MRARGRSPPPEGRKNLRKFVEIDNVKFNNVTKNASLFPRSWKKIYSIIEKSIRPGGSGGGVPDSSEFI